MGKQSSGNEPKKLTLAEISKLAKDAQKYKEVLLLNGQYKLTIHENFLETSIRDYLLDVQDALQVLKSEDADMKDVANYFIIMQALIIKHFADSGMKNLKMSKKRDVAKLLDVAENLIKIGLFESILKSFDPNEIKKLDEKVAEVRNIGNQLGDMLAAVTLTEKDKLEELGLEMVGDTKDEGSEELQGIGEDAE